MLCRTRAAPSTFLYQWDAVALIVNEEDLPENKTEHYNVHKCQKSASVTAESF